MSGRKCKGFRVLEKEGYGKDQHRNGGTIEEILCRFNFPKFPMNETKILIALPKDTEEELLKACKADLLKIIKYLIRQTYQETIEGENKSWNKLKGLSFF